MLELGRLLSGPWPLWLLAAAGAALSALAVASYRPAFRILSRREAALLLALRAGAIAALVLFLAVNWHGGVEAERTVAVLVDASESMSIRDSVGGEARIETALKFLDGEGAFRSGLPRRVRVRTFAFHGSLSELAPGDAPPGATGEKTDLDRALKETASRFPAGELAGIVALTDGGAARGTDPAGAAERAAAPVFPVGVGAAGPARAGFRDLSIASVKANDAVFVNNDHRVDVAVEGTGFPGAFPVEVAIRRGGEVVARAPVKGAPGSFRAVATLSFRPAQEGIFDYEVSVPVLEGEAVAANNSTHFPLHVLGGKIRVLYVEGTLRPEGKFLRKALVEDPNVDLTTLIRTGPGRFLQEGAGERLVRDGALALTRDALDRFAVLILGDIERAGLPGDFGDQARRFADEGGGGILALGGRSALGAGGWAGSTLAEALPVLLDPESGSPRAGKFPLALTAEGSEHPVFAGYERLFPPLAEGKDLPPLENRNPVAGVKPGAAVLATAGVGGPPLIAAQRFGRGKTMALLTDTTWLWYLPLQGLKRESPFHRFWSQSVRWLTDTGKDLDESSPLRLWTSRRTCPVGSEIRFEVRLPPLAEGSPGFQGLPQAEAVGPSGKSVTLALAGTERFFSGRLAAGEPGIHKIRVRAVRADGKAYEREVSVAAGGRSEEFERVAQNPALLGELASRSGGRVFTPADGAALAAEIAKRLEGGSKRSDARLDDPLFLIAGLLLLCAEWALRRRMMLV
jgi:hypothetical protein